MTTLKPILVFSEGISMAHVVRPLVLASALKKRGYNVVVACPDFRKSYFQNADLQTISLPIGDPGAIYKRIREGQRMFGNDNLFVDEDLKLIDSVKPCLICADFRVTALLIAEKLSIPAISISSSTCHPGFDRGGTIPDAQAKPHWMPLGVLDFAFSHLPRFVMDKIIDHHTEPLHQLSDQLAVRQYPSFYDYLCLGDLCILVDHPEIMPVNNLRPSDIFYGPMLWHPQSSTNASSGNDDYSSLKRGIKTVYISLGTQDSLSLDFLNETLSQLLANNFQVVLSRGHRAANISVEHPLLHVFDFVDEEALSPLVDLVIYHGGSLTSYHWLSKAIPMIALPGFSDPHYYALAIKRLGVGNYFRPSRLKPTQLVKSIAELLSNPSTQVYSKKAQHIISAYDNSAQVMSRIDDLMKDALGLNQAV